MRSILFGLALCFFAESAMAHGTGGRLDEAGGIRLLAEYDDGEPMSYAEVEVRAPEDDPVFQTGRTDRNGVFLFLPDHGGKWRVTVNDGMGHQLVLAREITGTGTSSPQAVASPATVPGKKPLADGDRRAWHRLRLSRLCLRFPRTHAAIAEPSERGNLVISPGYRQKNAAT